MDIVLVSTYHDLKSETVDGELPILRIQEADPQDYPDFVKAGAWEDGGEILVQPHQEAKVDGRYRKVDIAVRMTSAQAESVEAVTTEPQGYRYQRHTDIFEGIVYFVPPAIWKRNAYNQKYERTIVGHYTAGGKEEIRIHFTDGRKESMCLFSKFRKEEDTFYKKLVFDLLSMEQRLCIEEKSAASMAVKWGGPLYQEAEEMVEEFCSTLHSMEKDVQPELKPFKEKKAFHKIRKMTSRALIEHEIFHKEKVRSTSYQEDLDTYEHRAVKTYLGRLKKLVRLRREMEAHALKSELEGMKNNLDLSDEELEQRIKDQEDWMNRQKSRLEGLLEQRPSAESEKGIPVTVLFRIYHIPGEEGGENGILEFQTGKKNQIKVKSGSFKSNPVLGVEAGGTDMNPGQIMDAEGCRYKVWEDKKWSGWKKYEWGGAGETKFISVAVPVECTEAASILFHYLQSDERIITENCVVGIGGYVAPGYGSEGRNRHSKFEFVFKKIEEIGLYDIKTADPSKEEYKAVPQKGEHYRKIKDLDPEEKDRFQKEFREYILQLEPQGYDDIGFYKEEKAIREQYKKLDAEFRDQEKPTKNWGKLEQWLDKADKSPLMTAASPVKTPVRASNLFSFHPVYKKMYALMLKEARKMEGVDYDSEDPDDEFQIAKLCELYEVWSCLRLVCIFIEKYGFELLDPGDGMGTVDLKAYIQGVLDGIHNETAFDRRKEEKPWISGTEPGAGSRLNGTRFDLKGEVGGRTMKVTVWYDREIEIDTRRLRPDIIMTMQMMGIERTFILDAKYRSNSDYDGIQDLCQVAFAKYTPKREARFENRPIRIDGSFIIHSSMGTRKEAENEKKSECVWRFTVEQNENMGNRPEDGRANNRIEVKYDPRKYLGAYQDLLAEKLWLNGWKAKDDTKEQLRNWAKWQRSVNNHENRIGIVAETPEMHHLEYLLQMIMEQHFGLYRERCWICGRQISSEHVEHKLTAKGYSKYHIKCPGCRRLVVETHCGRADCPSHSGRIRLGKHSDDYLAQWRRGEGNVCWSVSCPKCRQLPSSDKENLIEGILGASPNGMELPFD